MLIVWIPLMVISGLWLLNISPWKCDARCAWHDDSRKSATIAMRFSPRYWNPRYWTARSKFKSLDNAMIAKREGRQ